MPVFALLRQAQRATGRSLSVFVKDVGHGLLAIGHNGLAVLGLAVVAVLVFATGRAELRQQAEGVVLEWLQERHEERSLANGDVLQAVAEPEAINRATATNPAELPRQQAAVAQWLARRYKVAPEPISALVQEAWNIGQRASLDPTLILAIMAIESSFNPFAQSPVGAQGLMQVMTRVHPDKYEAFGGNHAAFDPISNLRVGVQVLKECIRRAGSVQEGLKQYVGAALSENDGGYASRVMMEQDFLRRVASGKAVPLNVSNQPVAPREPATEGEEKAPQVALLR